MKRYFLFVVVFLLLSFLSFAQTKPFNVVFDITSKDTADQRSLIRWLKAISSERPDAQLEVVLYGQSLDMVTTGSSAMPDEVKSLATNKNISFKVCEAAMKRHNLDKSRLLPGVGTVPDGIYEIVAKQSEGWGYIKAAR